MELVSLRLSVTRDYLFKNGSKYVLVDTGYKEDWKLFSRRLEEAGIQITQISHLILTHHHDDHVGLVHKVVAMNPAIVVVMSLQTKELLLAGKNDVLHGGGLLNKRVAALLRFKQLYVSLIVGERIDSAQNLMFEPYKARENDIVFGAEVRLRDIGIEADATLFFSPGHSIDSVSILFGDGDCLVGDAAANFLAFAGTKNCVVFVRDLEEYYRTWEDILARGAKRIFPAHGAVFDSDRLRRNLRRNKAQDMVVDD
ncbi:MAG TPA: MBL fold metallo-hydrolase [Rectinemataceae bacterium]|nr:MBL fold metallo-hydrolase [Rectinemataceae bacterium]